MQFNDLQTTKKGNIGEQFIKKMLIKSNYAIYTPDANTVAHSFDILAIKNKKDYLIVEVKTKARLYRRKETGINVTSYNDYMRALKEHNFRVFLVFVDDLEQRIYGNYLDTLEEETKVNGRTYPYNEKTSKGINIRYYALEQMKHIRTLTLEEVALLRKYSTYKRCA